MMAAQTVSVVDVAEASAYWPAMQLVIGLQTASVMVAKTVVVFDQGVASGDAQFTGVGQT